MKTRKFKQLIPKVHRLTGEPFYANVRTEDQAFRHAFIKVEKHLSNGFPTRPIIYYTLFIVASDESRCELSIDEITEIVITRPTSMWDEGVNVSVQDEGLTVNERMMAERIIRARGFAEDIRREILKSAFNATYPD